MLRWGVLALATLPALLLTGALVASAGWSIQRRWHGISLERGTYHSGEVQLDHGVLRWELHGERPVPGFFDDLVDWSSFESGYGLLEGWDLLPVIRGEDDGVFARGEVRLPLPWLVVTAPTVLMWIGVWRRRGRGRAGCCSGCGYDRKGLAQEAACPECGAGAPG
jgi:hypothetical protein